MVEEASSSAEELSRLVENQDALSLKEYLSNLAAEEVGYLVNRLQLEEQESLMTLLAATHPSSAATLLEHLQDSHAADLVSILPPSAAAAVFEQMDSDDRADVISEMEEAQALAVLAALEPGEADELKKLSSYDPDTAGGLMITEYLSHPVSANIQVVLDDLRSNAEEYRNYDVQYVYVTGDSGVLLGVIRLRDLVLSPPGTTLEAIVIKNPRRVSVVDRKEQLGSFFHEHGFFAAPVVDESGVLVGVVRRAAVEAAHAEGADRALMAFGGIIGGEELRSMSTRGRIARRLAFLCPNILLNLAAASVVAVYEPTIAAVTALAIFLPMMSDMSGCAGNQAVAVSIREMSLGLLKPRDIAYALRKEVSVGIVNGIVLGGLVGLIAYVMRGEQWPLIGVVIGGAMCFNSLVAVVVGGTVPLALKRVGVDPALAASPILTTFTDLCGFFLTLSLATALLL